MKMHRRWRVAGVVAGGGAEDFLVFILLVLLFLIWIFLASRRGSLHCGKLFSGGFRPAPARIIQPAKANNGKAVTAPDIISKTAHIQKFSH